MQDKTKWEEEFDERFKNIKIENGGNYFTDSQGQINHPMNVPYPYEIKQFIHSLINELKEECIGKTIGNDKDSSELDIEFLHGKAVGYNQKREEIINIFKKYE